MYRHLCGFILFGVACGGGSDVPATPPPSTPAAVAAVFVTASATSVLVGQPLQLTATVRDASGNVLSGRAVTSSTGDSTKLTVSTSGLATGRNGEGLCADRDSTAMMGGYASESEHRSRCAQLS